MQSDATREECNSRRGGWIERIKSCFCTNNEHGEGELSYRIGEERNNKEEGEGHENHDNGNNME